MTFSVTADRSRVEISIALSSVAIRKNLYILEMHWLNSMDKPKKDRPISCRDLDLSGKEDWDLKNVTSHLQLLRLENYQQFLSSQSSPQLARLNIPSPSEYYRHFVPRSHPELLC